MNFLALSTNTTSLVGFSQKLIDHTSLLDCLHNIRISAQPSHKRHLSRCYLEHLRQIYNHITRKRMASNMARQHDP